MSAEHRAAATELIRLACHSRDPGRPFTDPIYRAVTEGRQDAVNRQIALWSRQPPATRGKRPFYSSCGDLAHWLLMRLGVRLSWINRDELDGWSYRGANNNVTTLHHSSNPTARRVRPDDRFQAGDVLIVGTALQETTHVTCVLEHVPEIGYLLTGDYGQPHGALRDSHEVYESEGRLWRGQRSIDSVLVLDDVVATAKIAGALAPIERPEQWLERMELR